MAALAPEEVAVQVATLQAAAAAHLRQQHRLHLQQLSLQLMKTVILAKIIDRVLG